MKRGGIETQPLVGRSHVPFHVKRATPPEMLMGEALVRLGPSFLALTWSFSLHLSYD